jgi:uracil-DNA glycosylase
VPSSVSGWDVDLSARIPQHWAELLGPGTVQDVSTIGRELARRSVAEAITPEPDLVFRALELPANQVKVVIVGQDPYPTAGHAMGLSFSLPPHTHPLPPSAKNIRTELASDLGIELGDGFDLTSWAEQGVLLLNRHLTTAVGQPGAHSGLGWDQVTNQIISSLATSHPRFVAILWGAQAQQLRPVLGVLPRIESAHPSPLSARRGFFGSSPFSRTNSLLVQMGHSPIDWSLG